MNTSTTLSSLSGEIAVNRRILRVNKKVGEGGFSFVYLVHEVHDDSGTNQMGDYSTAREGKRYCLKATTVQTEEQKRISETEAGVLRLAERHPNVVDVVDVAMRPSGRGRMDHFILMEVREAERRLERSDSGSITPPSYITNNILFVASLLALLSLASPQFCSGGHAFDLISRMQHDGRRWQYGDLIRSIGQITVAVGFLHKNGITHRDLKLENFLIDDRGTWKLCDFGSCVRGDTRLENQGDRAKVEEVIGKTTTQVRDGESLPSLLILHDRIENLHLVASFFTPSPTPPHPQNS